MSKLRLLLQFWFCIFLANNANAVTIFCQATSHKGYDKQADELFKTNCVSVCSKILKKESPADLKVFQNKCEQALTDERKPFAWGDTYEATKKILDQAYLQCIPLATKNTVVHTYELIKALPSIVGYLVSGAWAKNLDGPQAQAYEFCKGSSDCRRAMARNTLRFMDKNPDGSYKISDADVDKQISKIDFNDLHQQAIHDVPMAQQECQGYLGSLRRQMSSDGEEWTPERHQKVSQQMAEQHPHCPGLLKLTEPTLKEPEKSETQVECFRREKEDPSKCLGLREKITVGMVCIGDEFRKEYDKQIVELCATVAEALVPIPLIGPQTKFLPKLARGAGAAGIEAQAGTVVADGIDVGIVNHVAQDGTQELAAPAAKELTSAQSSFVGSYRQKVFVGEAQNSKYIAMAENSAKEVAENKTRYFDVENSVMKKLNDKTNDKELVTSLTNFQKETVLNRLDALKAKYPDIDFEVYSDFKSVKIGMKSSKEIDPATHEKLLADLNKLYGESNKELAAKLKELKIEVPEAGPTDQWFKAGYGRSVDEAAIAARKARQNRGEAQVVDYTSKEVRESMSNALASTEKKRLDLANSQSFSPLMEKNAAGVSLPREDVFDLVRKNDSPDDLAKAISKRYDLKSFTPTDALRLQDYAKSVDEFSPTILIAKRENPNLDAATTGGLSADFLGMGAANAKHTAEGIAGKTSVEQALIGAREGEKKVTGIFKKRMESFKKIVGDASCSGDDCAMAKMMTDKEKTKVMQQLAKNPETRGIRMSFVGSNVSKETRMQLASHGESIEKVFRKELEGKIPYDKLNKLTFGFDMKASQLNQGTVNLVIGRGGGARLTAKEQAEMTQAFARAVEKTNASKNAAYLQGSGRFAAKEILWVPGMSLLGAEDSPDSAP